MGYCWDQTDEEIRIYLSVQPASSDEVQCDFSNRSCSLTASIGQQRFFFEIKRTFAAIDPSLSLVKVPRSRKQVAVRLRKHEAGVEWPALRCIESEFGHAPI